MKNTGLKGLAVLMLITAVTTGCSEKDGPVNNDSTAVSFESSLSKLQSRASDTDWDYNDAIGVYMVSNGTSSIVDGAENWKFVNETQGGMGFFHAEYNNNIYFPVNGENVDFVAYYPWSPDVIDWRYNVNVSDQGNPSDIDLLYANSHREYDMGFNKTYYNYVPLVFDHMLSKLIINVQPGPGLTHPDLQYMNLTIKNMLTRAVFDLEIAELHDKHFDSDIVPYTLEEGSRYQSILIPGENFENWSLEFEVNGDIFVWNVPYGTRLESGKVHEWTILIQRIPVLLSATINDWEIGEDLYGEAE